MICNRCGDPLDARVHACLHPQHAAIDPECVYASLTVQPPPTKCDICRAVRLILSEGSSI